MTSLLFFSSTQYCDPAHADQVLNRDLMIIADKKSDFEGVDAVAACLKLNENDLMLLKAVANERLSPQADTPSSAEFTLCHGAVLRRVVIGCLPTACSRHNTPSRSHGIAAIFKTCKFTRDATVFLMPTVSEYAHAQACSVSRQFPLFSTKSAAVKQQSIHVVVHFPAPVDNESDVLANMAYVSENIRLAQRLVDAPPNILHTDAYVQECLDLASKLGCGIEVIQGEELDKRGFGGLWGVGKASEHLPALVILSHIPAGHEQDQSICMVGKGIVYDTGGLSIKTPGTNMAGMKTDMGGSAAVLGAFACAVQSNLQKRVHALLCISENSVGPLSTRPDDVHVMLSGKTVEVNNTDAEGRLVLSDGCNYATKQLNPSVIIDIATLTGAQLIATGRNHAAVYCSDEGLEHTALAVGRATGDLTFPICYCPEFYRAEYKSQVADMKNSVADRGNAQASCAGQFIGNHIEDYLNQGGKWLHVDMAGPVSVGERATGYGVALLFGLLREAI